MQVCRVLGFLTFYLMLWLTLSHSISHTAGAFQSAWGIRQGFTEEVVLRCISKDEEEYGRWIGKTGVFMECFLECQLGCLGVVGQGCGEECEMRLNKQAVRGHFFGEEKRDLSWRC